MDDNRQVLAEGETLSLEKAREYADAVRSVLESESLKQNYASAGIEFSFEEGPCEWKVNAHGDEAFGTAPTRKKAEACVRAIIKIQKARRAE
jgi:hypothetical protein